ncbi:AAA family ATPase [Leptospira kmetyi]
MEARNSVFIEDGRFEVVKTSLIYGPNASGKSNIIQALDAFRYFVINSHELKLDEEIPVYEPFKLKESSQSEPVGFSVEFIADGIRYLYSISFNRNTVLTEELIQFKNNRKARLFKRVGKEISYGTHLKGEKRGVENLLLANHLFLSRAANLGLEQFFPVYRFFQKKLNIIQSDFPSRFSTTRMLKSGDSLLKQLVMGFLNAADLNISDLKIETDINRLENFKLPDNFPAALRDKVIEDMKSKEKIGHPMFSASGKFIKTIFFDLEEEESSGTAKMYDLAGKILDAIGSGSILVIDEFDSNLHPTLAAYIIELFNSVKIGSNESQLILATHNILNMEIDVLSRDQIWFTKKNQYGESELYSLDEFDKNVVRKNGAYSKWYLEGRFSAIPNIELRKFQKLLISSYASKKKTSK